MLERVRALKKSIKSVQNKADNDKHIFIPKNKY